MSREDPYSAYGGSAVTSNNASGSDPYAKYGGTASNQDVLAAQAAKYPTAQEQGDAPGSVVPPESHLGITLHIPPGGVLASRLWDALKGHSNPDIGQINIPALGETGNSILNIVKTGVEGGVPAAGGAALAEKGVEMLPSAARAGKNLETVFQAAKDVAPDVGPVKSILSRVKELALAGNKPPQVLTNTAEGIAKGTLKYGPQLADELPGTFDLASKAKSLSAEEAQQVAKTPMAAQVSRFASAMHDANRDAAASVGMGELYDSAMKEYRQAKTLQAAGDVIKKYGLQIALTTGLGYAGYRLVRDLWSGNTR